VTPLILSKRTRQTNIETSSFKLDEYATPWNEYAYVDGNPFMRQSRYMAPNIAAFPDPHLVPPLQLCEAPMLLARPLANPPYPPDR
jgi:hypothetical protein